MCLGVFRIRWRLWVGCAGANGRKQAHTPTQLRMTVLRTCGLALRGQRAREPLAVPVECGAVHERVSREGLRACDFPESPHAI